MYQRGSILSSAISGSKQPNRGATNKQNEISSRIIKPRTPNSKEKLTTSIKYETENTRPNIKSGRPLSKVYVHPLSQIILEHLQNQRHEWITRVGLDQQGLTINRDGSFVLKFPSLEPTKQLNGNKEQDRLRFKDNIVDENGTGKIWTTYDPVEKKHWLAVKVGPLSGQYLLQDNMKPAWHTSKESTPKKIQLAVDEMIQSIDQISTGKIADLLAQATSPPSAGKD